MSDTPVLEPGVVTAIEDYFRSLQAHASAEQMLADVLTSDFQTGLVGGHMWTGEQGLRDFLSARSVFFDESHQLLQIFDRGNGGTPWRVAAQLVDGFADLNGPAKGLFAMPQQGLNT